MNKVNKKYIKYNNRYKKWINRYNKYIKFSLICMKLLKNVRNSINVIRMLNKGMVKMEGRWEIRKKLRKMDVLMIIWIRFGIIWSLGLLRMEKIESLWHSWYLWYTIAFMLNYIKL